MQGGWVHECGSGGPVVSVRASIVQDWLQARFRYERLRERSKLHHSAHHRSSLCTRHPTVPGERNVSQLMPAGNRVASKKIPLPVVPHTGERSTQQGFEPVSAQDGDESCRNPKFRLAHRCWPPEVGGTHRDCPRETRRSGTWHPAAHQQARVYADCAH